MKQKHFKSDGKTNHSSAQKSYICDKLYLRILFRPMNKEQKNFQLLLKENR